jgi:hypothetical protein
LDAEEQVYQVGSSLKELRKYRKNGSVVVLKDAAKILG